MQRRWSLLCLAGLCLAAAASAQDASIDSLAKDLSSEYPEVRHQAILTLIEKGPTAAAASGALIEALTVPQMSPLAREALAAIGADAVAALARGLKSKQATTRRWCLELMQSHAESARRYEEEIAAMQKSDADTAVRWQASRVLARWRGEKKPELKGLEWTKLPEGPVFGPLEGVPEKKRLDAKGLEWTQLPEGPVFGPLQGVQEKNRFDAEVILTRADGNIESLRDLLSKGAGQERAQAAFALEKLGGKAASATSDLVRALDDPLATVRSAAVRALAGLAKSNEKAVDALILGLKGKYVLGRHTAAEGLGLAGKAAEDALPELRRWMAYGTMSVRLDCALAIWRISGKTDATLALLTEGASSDEPWDREMAARNLGRMGAAAKPALPMLKEMAERDEDDQVANAADIAVQIIENVVLK